MLIIARPVQSRSPFRFLRLPGDPDTNDISTLKGKCIIRSDGQLTIYRAKLRKAKQSNYKNVICQSSYLIKVNYDPEVSPLHNQVGVDLDGEVAVVNLEDLEVVEADGDVERTDAAATIDVDWGHVSGR
jgi:hypothetical protein